jgi:hypothetical protein
MVMSKPVNLDETQESWFEKFLHNTPVISTVYWRLRQFYRKVARSWAFARLGWNNYDFDSAYALDVLAFKLARVQQHLLHEGHTVQDETTQKSLRLVIRLLQRLRADKYSYFYDRHNKKWNPTGIEMTFEELPDSELLEMVTYRHQLPAEEQEREGAELRRAFELDDAMQERDARWCFSILAKYYRHWWD